MNYYMEYIQIIHIKIVGDRSGRDRMVVGSTTQCLSPQKL